VKSAEEAVAFFPGFEPLVKLQSRATLDVHKMESSCGVASER
jgi:hypothetical protein